MSQAQIRSIDDPSIPLVVEFEGGLLSSSLRSERVIRFFERLGKSPNLAMVASGVLDGVESNPEKRAVPFDECVANLLRTAVATHRKITLITAGDVDLARAAAAHLGVLQEIGRCDPYVSIRSCVGASTDVLRTLSAYCYVGSGAVSPQLRDAALHFVTPGELCKLSMGDDSAITPGGPKAVPSVNAWTSAVRALRPHQWLKNLLVLVPLFTSFSFLDHESVLTALVAFGCFSALASANYLINDLVDARRDRLHPTKRRRPIASGAIGGDAAAALAIVLLAGAIVVGAQVGAAFLFAMASYLALTVAYSLRLKAFVILDVLLLACLYTIRIIAGALAIGVNVSSWLLAFSVFLFFSLALVKRSSELLLLAASGIQRARGRDYGESDLAIIWPAGVGAALSAVVVFGLFITAPEAMQRYAFPELMWVVAVALLYWLMRIWIKTARGEMSDDPVVFAIKNAGSRWTIVFMVVATIVAHYGVSGFR